MSKRLDPEDLNRTVFISDNLPFLRSLDDESIDLVCIDPPFGKKQTFKGKLKPPLTDEELEHEYELLERWGIQNEDDAYDLGIEFPDQSGTTARFKDIWDFQHQIDQADWDMLDRRHPAIRHLIESIWYTHSEDRAAYIAFMTLRMIEIKRILKASGSVYLHCDNEANAYLRQMMDAVFGQSHFRNEIIWVAATSTKEFAHRFGNNHETILGYSKDTNPTWNNVYLEHSSEYLTKGYSDDDHDGRGPWTKSDLTQSGWRGGESGQTWRGISMKDRDKHWITPTGRGLGDWIVANVIPNFREIEGTLARLDALDAHNMIYWPERGIMPRLKRYLASTRGSKATDVFTDIPPLQGSSKESTNYPTQKPQRLARRLIEASSNPGDIVLDCFAGCAYVPVAAELSKRRWIACDMSPRAWTVVRRQFEKHPDLGIVTQGRRISDKIELKLERTGAVIQVRGPLQEEIPQHGKQPPPINGDIPTGAKPKLRQKPIETSKEIWDAFVGAHGPDCWYCGATRESRTELHLDHIEPKDGANDDCWNRALACAPCNLDKGDRLTPEETVDKAFEAGRIKGELTRDHRKSHFAELHHWAKNRWDCVRQRTLDGME